MSFSYSLPFQDLDPCQTKHRPRRSSSPNNPCPFLRALVANGYVDGHIVPLGTLTEDIGLASGKTGMGLIRAKVLTYGIAMIANGHPLRSVTSGAMLDELRNGPLDKHGAGSRILEVDGQVNLEQIDRLASFGQRIPPIPMAAPSPG